MQRTVHEVLELRDLIVACDAAANKLLHAASTARDADVVQMLGAHERTFRQQCHQLKQALAGDAGLYGLGAPWDGGTGAAAPAPAPGTPAHGGGAHHAGVGTTGGVGTAWGLGAAGGPGAPGSPGGPGGPGGPEGMGGPGGPGSISGHGGHGGPGGAGGPGSPGNPSAASFSLGAGPAAGNHGVGPRGSTFGATGPGVVPVRGPAGGAGAGARPVHPAEAGGAPGYPPTGPGTYGYLPSAAAQDHRYRAGDPAGDGRRPIRGGSPELGPQGDGADATRQALRHRPELVGWEPGAGNNEGWQAGARREPTGLEAGLRATGGRMTARDPVAPGRVTAFDNHGSGGHGDGGDGTGAPYAGVRDAGARGTGAPEAEAFTAVRPVGYGPGAAAQVAGSAVPVAEAGPGFRGHWAAQGGPEGGPGTEGIRFDSPRVGFGPEWAPNPWTGPAAGSTPGSGFGPGGVAGMGSRPGANTGTATGSGIGIGTPQTVGFTAPPSTWAAAAARNGAAQAGGVRLADPDALAVADGLQDCKHMALRMMVAATEAADRHLGRMLYQMAGQHLEMAGQHYEWLRRRGLYTVSPAPADLVRHLEDDIRRTEQALKVMPVMDADAAGGAVNTSLAGYPSGGLKGAFGGQPIRN